MKYRIITHISLLAALAAPYHRAGAQEARRWVVDPARPAAASFNVFQGETIYLEPSIVSYGTPIALAGLEATLYWQDAGMGNLWYEAPATITINPPLIRAIWTPAHDTGAPTYKLFIGLKRTDTGTLSYSAHATLTMLPAPGATPNELPLPTRTIDFATIDFANAPWLLPADLPAAIQAIDITAGRLRHGPLLVAPTNNAWRVTNDATPTAYATLSPYAISIGSGIHPWFSPDGSRYTRVEPHGVSIWSGTTGASQAITISETNITRSEGGTIKIYTYPATSGDLATTADIATAIQNIPSPYIAGTTYYDAGSNITAVIIVTNNLPSLWEFVQP